MEQKTVDFIINPQEKIQFIFVADSAEDSCFDTVDVVYVNSELNLSLLLCKDLYIFLALWGLKGKLQAVLKNELELRPSRFQWWGGQGVSSCIYQKDGKTIFGITPDYPAANADARKDSGEQYLSYKEFMQSYKPLVVTELSPETVHAWLAQAAHLSKKLDCDCSD